MATLTNITIWPLKGFRGRDCQQATVRRGVPLDGDRRFALRLPRSKLNPANPGWASKRHFLQGVNCAETATVDVTWSDDGAIASVAGEQFQLPRQGAEFAERLSVLTNVPGLVFYAGEPAANIWLTDQSRPRISLLNRASVEAFAKAAGCTVDPSRFRGNLIVEGWEAFAEEGFGKAGSAQRSLKIGQALFDIVEPIERCEAPGLNPQSGNRDADVLTTLKRAFGHRNCGLFLEVTQGGVIRPGDPIELV